MLLTASHFSSHPLPAFGEEPLLLRVIAHLGLICTSMIIDCEHFFVIQLWDICISSFEEGEFGFIAHIIVSFSFEKDFILLLVTCMSVCM